VLLKVTPTACGTGGNPCLTAGCDRATGCFATPVAAGTSCSDGTACDPATGTCNPDPAKDGTACTPATPNACFRSFVCQHGSCVGADPVVCPAPADACHGQGGCDPATGQCANPNAPDGTACDDGSGAAGMALPAVPPAPVPAG
jgi:hypothetical protein